MDFSASGAYFPIEYRGLSESGAGLHIFPQTVFTDEEYAAVCRAARTVDTYTNTTGSGEFMSIFAERPENGSPLEETVMQLVHALSRVPGIQQVIVNDGSRTPEEEAVWRSIAASFPEQEADEPDWDTALGIRGLPLNYPAHAVCIDGENFTFDICFAGGKVSKQQADAVRSVLHEYDFGLTDDEYAGEIDITSDGRNVTVYLDMGNADVRDEDSVIHGILLALNSVQGIEKVIING